MGYQLKMLLFSSNLNVLSLVIIICLSCIDSPDASRETTMEVDHTDEVPSTEFDNEPLSKWIVELNSPLLIDSSSMLISLIVLPSFRNIC